MLSPCWYGFISTILLLYTDLGGVVANPGIEFLITFPQSNNEAVDNQVMVTIDPGYVGADGITVDVIMKDPYVTMQTTLTNASPGDMMTLGPDHAFPKGNVKGHKYLIRVTASGMINVVVRNGRSSNFDTYLTIPVSELGKQYLTFSYYPTTNNSCSFVVIATASQPANIKFRFPLEILTAISFTYNNISYSNGDLMEIYLDSYQAVQLQFLDETDITGAYLESDKSIAVWSGVNRTKHLNISRSHLLEQVPPTFMAGKQFAAFPSPCNSYIINTYRVLSLHPWTSVTVYYSLENITEYTLARSGNVLEMEVGHDSSLTYITASEPVLVYWVSKSEGIWTTDLNADPAMMWIPPLDVQMPSSYRMTMRRHYQIVNTIAFVIATTAMDGLSLNDKPLDQAGSEYFDLTTFSITGRPDLIAGCLTGIHPVSLTEGMAYLLKQDDGIPFVAAGVTTTKREGEGHPLSYGLNYTPRMITEQDDSVACCVTVDNQGVLLVPNECSYSVVPYTASCCIVDYQLRSCRVKSASWSCSISTNRKLSSSNRTIHADSLLACHHSCLNDKDGCIGANFDVDSPDPTSCQLLYGQPMGFDENGSLGSMRHLHCSPTVEYTLL